MVLVFLGLAYFIPTNTLQVPPCRKSPFRVSSLSLPEGTGGQAATQHVGSLAPCHSPFNPPRVGRGARRGPAHPHAFQACAGSGTTSAGPRPFVSLAPSGGDRNAHQRGASGRTQVTPVPSALQVSYRWNTQGRTSVIETNQTSVELSLPLEEDYIIEIKPVSDGGDGSASGQIRIPKITSKRHFPSPPARLPSPRARSIRPQATPSRP